ncbi:MAG: hypothetical protein JW866_07650 [Ignavibacteriales bacterium]|nr:hypothetical protein [Ignavibacteriales bacterium]
MNEVLKKVKDVSSECCVTVILNTHRTKPDSKRDPILLKNLVKDAETRLYSNYEKRFVWPIMEKLNKLTDDIDHDYNLESLVLFANENIAEYTRLPILVEDRVVIDNTFATRDLVRAMHQELNYYVLVLSQKNVRLIEAYNDKVVEEIGNSFPIENTNLYSTSKSKIANAPLQTNLINEFFNRVDKEVNKLRKENPLPVLICTEESNYFEYLKIVDEKDSIIGHLNKNRLDEKNYHIVPEAWAIVKENTIAKNNQRKQELIQAVNTGKFLSDFNDIWRAILHKQGKTLFIEQGFFQPAIIEGETLKLVPLEESTNPNVIDDIIDEMIEHNLRYGGDNVFLPKGELKEFQGLGLITRY